jgi:FkbM family methyltransferase
LRPILSSDQTIELEPGLSLRLDLSKSNHEFLFWFHEEHESSLQWAIKSLLPKNGIFLDCGANLGLMGLLAIHHKQARALFIEPHPQLVERLKANIALNHFELKSQVFAVAASDAEGTALLYPESKSDGGHSLAPNGTQETPFQIQTQRLEKIIKDLSLDHIDFLKIDTEGFDHQALLGLGNFLSPKHISLLYVEMCGNYQAIWDLLITQGYRPFASECIYIDRLRELRRKNDNSQFFAPIEKPGDGNLLWCPKNSPAEEFLLKTCIR